MFWSSNQGFKSKFQFAFYPIAQHMYVQRMGIIMLCPGNHANWLFSLKIFYTYFVVVVLIDHDTPSHEKLLKSGVQRLLKQCIQVQGNAKTWHTRQRSQLQLQFQWQRPDLLNGEKWLQPWRLSNVHLTATFHLFNRLLFWALILLQTLLCDTSWWEPVDSHQITKSVGKCTTVVDYNMITVL